MSTAAIIAGFVISTVGCGFFLYGKRQLRIPQLLLGILLMVCPFAAPDAIWTVCIAALLFAMFWLALRAGW